MCESDMPHIVGNLLMMTTTLLLTSPQSDVCTRSYGLPKWQKSQFQKNWDSRLESPRKNNIWMQPPWLVIENNIRRKVVASSKFGSWWILWIRVCPWLIHAPKVLQLCTNQLVVWLQTPARPSYPKMLQARELTPTPFFSVVFILKLAFESFKKFRGASKMISTIMK